MAGTANFGELLEPGLKVIYGTEYNQHVDMHPRVFDVQKSSKAFEESLSLTEFSQVPVKTEGSDVDFEEPKMNWLHRLTHVTYGKGFQVTREMSEDDQYGKINKFTRGLAKSVRATRETITSNVLNNGFDNTYTGGDGLELFSTAHLLGGGGTYKNEPSDSTDLSATSLEQALIDIGDWVTDSGLLMAARVKMLVVPNELTWTATKLLDSTLDPDSANNAVNPAKSIFPFLTWNYLTDPDAWFLITDVMDGLIVYNRRMPEFTRDNAFKSENALFKTTFRISAGHHDPRGAYASPGA